MKNLSAIRKEKGLTQAELAHRVGIGMNSLARYERGEIQPSIEMASLIAEKLGVTINELIGSSSNQDWNLRLVTPKEVSPLVETVNLTGRMTSAALTVGDVAMGLVISAGYDVWRDDAKFEDLIMQIRKERVRGLKCHDDAE